MESDRSFNPVAALSIVLALCVAPALGLGQTPDSQSDTNKSWTATTELKASGGLNPTRTAETHSEADGRTVDKQTLERIGPDGRYEPYLDTERESVKVDATTVRTVERMFGRADGEKKLIQVIEEESRSLPGGEVKIVRTTSNPDGNGRLQIVQRETQDAANITPDVRQTKTTVQAPDINGGLAAVKQVEERERRSGQHSVEFRKSTLLPDGNGSWQLSEVREGTIKDEGKDSTKDERVLRPGSDGKLALVERTVSKESAGALGEKRSTVETYTTDVPGSAADGSLHLNQRVTSVQRTHPDGAQATEKQVEQRNPGEPDAGLRVTTKTIDIVRPGVSGTTQTETIQSLDSNGNLQVVSVDTGKTDKTPAIQVDIAKPAKPK